MKIKPYLYAAAILLVVVGVVGGIKALQIGKLIATAKEKSGPPPESVSSAEVTSARWERMVESVGSLRAVQGADLSTESSGVVTKILFENGAEVKKGDLLLELDTDTEQANLRSAQAEADLARTVYERTRKLRENNTVPQSEMDAAESQLRKMTALVEQLKATITKKQITAPFTGRLGIREVNLGQFVNNGDKIVSLQSLDPIYVDFLLPQQLLASVSTGAKLRVFTDVYPGRFFDGELTAINSEIDPVTRNIRLQGTLQNPAGELRPGMFVRVILSIGGADEVLSIPATAILRAPFGDSVFVLEETASESGETTVVARQRFIRTGRSQGDFVSVTEGLKAGEKVVTAGVFKLRNGSTVIVNNEMAPQPSAEPRPPNS
ncbi:MAG: efflux RND transporter periplasmic adaptor subunit [Chthoniobacterales bacterium]|nr:efflux RND transporter periplasmic adaptor subunit [Chthoniobacterales bacterium]